MSNTTVWHCLVIVGQYEDIPDLLQHAEPTAELYQSLISYTPAQHHSEYNKLSYFGPNFLTVIKRMVSVIFTKWYVRRVMCMLHYVGFWWWRESLQQTSKCHCTLCPQEVSLRPFTNRKQTWRVPNYGPVSLWGVRKAWIRGPNGCLHIQCPT